MKDEMFTKDMNDFFESIYLSGYMKNPAGNFHQLTGAGHSMFKQLFREIDIEAAGPLIISPDGPLRFLPFEVLLTSKPDPGQVNFRDLPYLIRKTSISYTYSAHLLRYLKDESVAKREGILGVSFSFGNNLKMSDLLGTDAELSAIEDLGIKPSAFLYGGTEREFKKEMNAGFDIIHIALHGSSDSSNIGSPGLYFQKGGAGEDGILHTHELYSLNTQAGLVFLSACQTGFGKEVTGEGIFSIARGFIFSGTQGVVQSLWKISDQTARTIIPHFYQSLMNGSSAHESLRESKLKYINQADEYSAHPYHWASFQYIGNDYKLRAANTSNLFVLVLIVILAALNVMFVVLPGTRS